LEWESSNEVCCHPATPEVLLGYLFRISDSLESLFVQVLLKEVEQEIQTKCEHDTHIYHLKSIGLFLLEGYKENCGHTCVPNNNQKDVVKCNLPFFVLANDKIIDSKQVSERFSTSFFQWLFIHRFYLFTDIDFRIIFKLILKDGERLW
jgi:hypothetical protein